MSPYNKQWNVIYAVMLRRHDEGTVALQLLFSYPIYIYQQYIVGNLAGNSYSQHIPVPLLFTYTRGPVTLKLG